MQTVAKPIVAGLKICLNECRDGRRAADSTRFSKADAGLGGLAFSSPE
jgi:hypothetical protein